VRPAVSVELGAALPAIVTSSDAGFPYSLQPHFDEKPLESLFDFDQFPENQESISMDDPTDFFNSAIFEHSSNSYNLTDQFDVKSFDLQTASGAATYACDGVLAVEI
jgi:transcriptional activator HAC1